MASLTIPAGGLGVPLELGSSATTVTNNGPGTLFYRDESPVTAALNDGSIAPGGSASLSDTQYVLASGAAASIQYVVSAVSAGGGGGGSGSGLPSVVVSKTANYTAAAGEFVLADATTAGFTVTLPTSPAAGALAVVKKTDGTVNIVTVAPGGGGTIDGDANATITSKNFGAVLEHTGSNAWKIAAVTASGGSNGVDGKTLRNGTVDPTGGVGTDGDFYLNTTSNTIFGPKASGAWGSGTSVKGAAGAIAQVQDEGSNVAVRGTLNFVGGGVTATDDAANSRTVITVPTSVVTARGRPIVSGTTYYTVPGAGPVAVAAVTQSANRIVYEPILVATDITLDQLAVVCTAAVATCTGRVAIYTADINWQPVALVIEPTTGTQLDLTATGTKTTACAQTLTTGRYLFASNVSTGNPSFAGAQCPHEYTGLNPSGTTLNLPISWWVANTYAAFPSTPVAWTNVNTGNTGFQHSVLARVVTP